MIPVDYELGRQYQRERVQEANSHRLARQAVTGWRSRVAHRSCVPTAKQLRVWIEGMVGLATRRAETQLGHGLTTSSAEGTSTAVTVG
jgi:hypothetical protein